MPDATTREELARLRAEMAMMRAAHSATVAELAALRRAVARPRRRRVLLPALCLALLIALVPLSVLAVNPFTDLTGGVHDANIDAIYNAGVTTGCVPNAEYCPTANVTREEMASFLARLGGLGTNPPVANAKTAQTAASAQDAAKVGGLAPSGLVRAGRAVSPFRNDTKPPTPFTVNAMYNTMAPELTAYETLATVTLNAPAAGFVLVVGSGTLASTAGTAAVMRLRDPVSLLASPPLFSLGPTSDVYTSPGLTYLFPVTAGDRAFILEVAKAGGDPTLAFNGVLTALYVPFGPTGGSTLDLP